MYVNYVCADIEIKQIKGEGGKAGRKGTSCNIVTKLIGRNQRIH